MGLFKVRRTITPGLIPEGLTYGEMAVNLADRILYVGGTAENAIEILGGSGNYNFFYQELAPGLSQGYGTTGETGEYDHLIGSRWLQSTTGREYVYINDGDQWYWMEPRSGEGMGGPGGGGPPPPAYIAAAFTSLTTNIPTTLELGQVAGNQNTTISWSRNGAPDSNWVTNSASYSASGFASASLFANADPLANSAPVSYPSFSTNNLSNNTLTLTLSAGQLQGSSPTISRSSQWWSKFYWGKSLNTAETNPLSLVNGNQRLLVSPSFPLALDEISFDAGPGYAYFFLHNAYRITLASLQGAPFSFTTPLPGFQQQINITNAFGASLPYKIYRSNQLLNGFFTVDITIRASQ